MPRIIVITDSGGRDAPATLDERVATIHLADKHSSGQLLERLQWAIEDAEREERSQRTKEYAHT